MQPTQSPVEKRLTKQEQSDIVDQDVRGTSLYADRLVRRLQASVKRLCAELEKKDAKIRDETAARKDLENRNVLRAIRSTCPKCAHTMGEVGCANCQRQRAEKAEAQLKSVMQSLKDHMKNGARAVVQREENRVRYEKAEAQLVLIERQTREEFGKCLTCASVHEISVHAEAVGDYANELAETKRQRDKIKQDRKNAEAALDEAKAERDAYRRELAALRSILKDPQAVEVNILRGEIARPLCIAYLEERSQRLDEVEAERDRLVEESNIHKGRAQVLSDSNQSLLRQLRQALAAARKETK